ncbi:MAG: 4-hydroxyphenylacetate 3-hydroxylase [Marmoricola sp.]|nr:4-hydroxyphenylacetate 3-hydroxylase [Marmoricola sp.]
MTVEHRTEQSAGIYGLKLPAGVGTDRFLLTRDEFLESLRDGRRILASDGTYVDDVTTHPLTRQGVQTLARYYEMQHDPAYADIMTFESDELGGRASVAWKVPRKKDDLLARRVLLELSTKLTLGTFGRPPDYGPVQAAGLLQIIDRIESQGSDWAEHVRAFATDGLRHNLMSTDLLADVQSDRNIPVSDKPGRLRIVSEDESGIVIRGAKPCNSIAVQGHVGSILTLLSPGINLDSAILAVVGANTPGLTFIPRESTLRSGSGWDRPVSRHVGDEVDAMMVFEDVFLPKQQVFSVRNEAILSTYYERGALPQWHILARLAYRARILVGVADMVVSVLGTDRIPQVRDAVADMVAYSKTVQAFVIAAEDTGHVQNGVFVPNMEFLAPGRLYAIGNLGRIMETLREICGQGMISRFTEKQFSDERFGRYLEEFLPGTGVGAAEKNQLFNFVWELTCGEQAMRAGLFENLNATPPGALRAFIYRSDRSTWADPVREILARDVSGS